MEVREIKKAASTIFMLGFFVGIIYSNVFAKEYIFSTGIFSDYFFEQYSVHMINDKDYLFFIMRIRLLPLFVVGIASCTKYKKLVASILILWTGFSSGLLFTAATLKLGLRGIVLCIAGILPHYICYIASYSILVIYMYTYPNNRWNYTKVMSLIIFILLGIISECYINPVIIELFIKMF